jgi:hypothetical protein
MSCIPLIFASSEFNSLVIILLRSHLSKSRSCRSDSPGLFFSIELVKKKVSLIVASEFYLSTFAPRIKKQSVIRDIAIKQL